MKISDKLALIAENTPKVFDAGKQAAHDAFWDDYQQNGNRQDYAGAFGGEGWTDKTFQPKYDMRPTRADYMFRKCLISDLDFILTHVLDGRTLDFSNCTNMTEAFSNAPNLTSVGVIDVRKAGANIANMFSYSNVSYISKLIVGENNVFTYFGEMRNLEHVIFEGTIKKSGINLQWSTKLDQESITSIINCLSTETTGLTVTLSGTAVDTAFATSEGGGDGTASDEWIDLVESKPNWTISLV